MRKFKGTKGEWKMSHSAPFQVEGEEEEYHGCFEVMCGKKTIVGVHAYSFWNQNFEESMANAKLIAAAPEMLEMLSSIENDENQVPKFLWDKIQLIIKKATE